MLFGLKAYDVATIASAFVLLAVSAAFASWVPAIRASRLDPVAALRSE
jgi:ABC-type lipoprotein release transport system permease subunit